MVSRYISLEELSSYGQVNEGDDTTYLLTAILWAETMFEQYTGSRFYQQTITYKQPLLAFVDKYGWLRLISRMVAPVTAVSTINVLYLDGSWHGDLTWQASNLVLPSDDAPPHPNAWEVSVFPDQQLFQAAPSQLLVRWTYTGGFATPPDSLKMTLLRMAWWKYKLREAPLGVVTNPAFGSIKTVDTLPNDLRDDLELWKRKGTGG